MSQQAECPVCGGDADCDPPAETLGVGALLDAQCIDCAWFFTSPDHRRRIDAAAACRPCVNCHQLCDSQLEFADYNDDQPWETCSACMATNEEMNAAIVRHAVSLSALPGPTDYPSN